MRAGIKINIHALKLIVIFIAWVFLIPSSVSVTVGMDLLSEDMSGEIEIYPQPAEPTAPTARESISSTPTQSLSLPADESQTTLTQPEQSYAQVRNIPVDHPMNDYSDVLLVVNDNSTISMQIADYVRAVRNIPDENICNITAKTDEQVDRVEFERIRHQIESYLGDAGLTDSINYIITTKGLPLRISHGNWRMRASVDSELCLILGPYATWINDATNQYITNPYYNKERLFNREEFHIYLVTRLTGYNFSDVKQLIDNAAASANQRESGGSFLFDQDRSSGKYYNPWRGGNDRMETAHNDLVAKGYNSTNERTSLFATDRNNIAGYCSWGTFDVAYYSTPVQNRGLDIPNNEAVAVPTGWTFNYIPFVEDITRNVTINRTARFSVNITRPTNNTGFTYISQNVTIKPGVRYFLSGYVRRGDVANYDGGGAILQIKAYNSTNDLVWIMNSTPRYGGPDTDFVSLYQIPYEPIPGVIKLMVSAGIRKSKGTAFFDDIALYEIKPHNTYVPGAIAETYGYSNAYTFKNPHWFYRLTVGDLIMDGITGVKGYVDYFDSYITSNAYVDLLFDMYTSGYSLAESFYAASPRMSWMDVVIGDPKCAPYFDVFPDATLSVENISFSDDHVNQGVPVTIQAKIENRGGSEVANLKVYYLVGDELENATELGFDNIASLPANNFKYSNFNWNTSAFNGTLTVWVFADYLDEVSEQNETNNYKSKQITINSFPYGLELKYSSREVYRGNIIDIFINVSDNETLETDLNCSIFLNHTTIGTWKLFSNINYKNDHWQTRFETDALTAIEWYDLMVIITDQSNASIEFVENKAFKVLNNPPVLDNVVVSRDVMNRTENTTMTFTAYDFETMVTENLIDISFRETGTQEAWFSLTGELTKGDNGDEHQWQFIYTASKTIKTGRYDLKLTLTDAENALTEIEQLDAILIQNNAPVIEKILLNPTSILRRDYVSIYIFGSDIETPRADITVELEYKLAFEGVSWSKLAKPTAKTTHWEAVFYTNISTFTGNYTVRARLKDADNSWTDYLSPESGFIVQNNMPVAKHNFGIELFSANEDEKIWFDAANSSDIEDNICSDFHWDFGDNSSSTEVKTHHIYTSSGEYNVTLTVYDKDFGSNSTVMTIKINNIKPTAAITVDKIQAMVNEPILFDASKSVDTISDSKNLSYLWDFDDNTTADQAKVSHSFIDSGTFSVSLTVTDDNGASDSKTLYITIEPLPVQKGDGKEKELDYLSILFLVLIVVIIIVIIGSVVWVVRKRRAVRTSKPGKTIVKEEALETVEADIVDVPEIAGKGEGAKVPIGGVSKTKKPSKAIEAEALGTGPGPEPEFEAGPTVGLPPDEIELTPKLPGAISKPEGERADISEVEIEYVPDLPPTTADGEVIEIETGTGAETVGVPEEEISIDAGEEILYPLPATVDSEPAEDAVDFVPPKIDLPIPEDLEQKPPSPEIEEAKKRGEGVSLDFKPPERLKKKD
ncbi:TIGR03790 family protein [[Eubacterium] cellulosolvens]